MLDASIRVLSKERIACSDQNITLQKTEPGLLDPQDQERMEMVLKYIEDGDLRHWTLPDIKAFNIGLSERRSKLNCITNPFMYEQVLILFYVFIVFYFDFSKRKNRVKDSTARLTLQL